MSAPRHACPCCGFLTMSSEARGSHDICPVCAWEDDELQFDDPDDDVGANPVSLAQARRNFREFGASTRERSERTRTPLDIERP